MPTKNKDKRSGKRPLNSYVKYSAVGFQMAFIIFLFTYGGYKIDGWLGMKIPVFTVVLSMLSIVVSIYYFIKDVSKFK